MCSRSLENCSHIHDVFGRLVKSLMATHVMSLMLIFPLFHVQGAGTTESVLTEMFASRTNKQIVAFSAAYLAGKRRNLTQLLPLWPDKILCYASSNAHLLYVFVPRNGKGFVARSPVRGIGGIRKSPDIAV